MLFRSRTYPYSRFSHNSQYDLALHRLGHSPEAYADERAHADDMVRRLSALRFCKESDADHDEAPSEPDDRPVIFLEVDEDPGCSGGRDDGSEAEHPQTNLDHICIHAPAIVDRDEVCGVASVPVSYHYHHQLTYDSIVHGTEAEDLDVSSGVSAITIQTNADTQYLRTR